MASDTGQTSKTAASGADVSVLDSALWARFSEERPLEEFARVWLAVQMRELRGVEAAVVVLDLGAGMVPVASFPKGEPVALDLADGVEATLDRDEDLLLNDRIVTRFLHIDGVAVGTVALRFSEPLADAGRVFRGLKWGTGWLISALRRDRGLALDADTERRAAVLDILGSVLEHPQLDAAALAAATRSARKLACSQVAVGLMRRGKLRIAALSDVTDLRMNTELSEAMAAAMTEAIDQQGTVLFPRREELGFMVSTHHEALVRQFSTGDALSIPMFVGTRVVGALHFQRDADAPFDALDLLVAEATAAALGPVLDDKRVANRSAPVVVWQASVNLLKSILGPGYFGRKIALLAVLALVGVFSTWTGTFRVSAESRVQGQLVRSVVAPFDGHIDLQAAREGDVVTAGTALAQLEQTDLLIELVRWNTDFARFEGEYDRALADRDAAAARIAEAEMNQATSKAELVTQQIDRSTLRAPFDAIVIEGDLSQSIGRAVRRGEELFKLAPLDAFRVTMEIDETQLSQVAVGQIGQLRLSSLPDRSFPLEVTRIVPRLEAAEGRNFALAEGQLLEAPSEIRPGMRGIAKVDVEQRLMIQIWAQPIIDWVRLALWRWTP